MAGSVLLAEMYGQLDWLQEPMKVVISEARRGSDLPEVAEELEGKALQRRKLRLKGGMSPISMGSLGHPELCRRRDIGSMEETRLNKNQDTFFAFW